MIPKHDTAALEHLPRRKNVILPRSDMIGFLIANHEDDIVRPLTGRLRGLTVCSTRIWQTLNPKDSEGQYKP